MFKNRTGSYNLIPPEAGDEEEDSFEGIHAGQRLSTITFTRGDDASINAVFTPPNEISSDSDTDTDNEGKIGFC